MIAIADLAEAEGRALRQATLRTGLGLACMGMAAILLLGGLLFCLWASYYWLSAAMSPGVAKVLVGLVMMAIAGGFAWTAIRINR